jgi:hypothetical protein
MMRFIGRLRIPRVLSVALTVAPAIAVCQSPPQSLYLIGGFERSEFSISMPTTLYRIENGSGLETISVLSAGSPAEILPNYEEKTVAVRPLGHGPASYTDSFVHFDGHISIEKIPESGPEAIAAQGCKPAFAEGQFGVGPVWSDAFQVFINSGKLTLPPSDSASGILCSLALSAPAGLTIGPETLVSLQIHTPALTVLASNDERRPNPEGLGSRLFHIFSTANPRWKTISVPGSVSFCRAFGSWAACVVAEGPSIKAPGEGPQEQYYKDINPELGRSIDAILDHTGLYFPGMLFLYDAATDQSYNVDTGRRDSEPLLISGNTLYFRVDNSVYRVELQGTAVLHLTDGKSVVNDPRVANMHWAFLGRN